jgi:membrane protein
MRGGGLIRRKLVQTWQILRGAVTDWLAHDAFAQAAAISFFALFSLAPILVMALATAGAIFGRDKARYEIVAQFTSLLGREGGEFIGTVVDKASDPEKGIAAGIVGMLMLLVAASGAFAQLRAALNLIWEVAPAKGLGVGRFVRARIASFGLALGVGFLLVVSLVISAVMAGVQTWAVERLPAHEVLLQVSNNIVSFVIIGVLFAAIYKALPDARIGWRETAIGAVITAGLFTIGKFGIGVYLGQASPGSVYGAAGSLAIVLIWIYYSSLIFLLGAEITHRHAKMLGKRNPPKEGAHRAPDLKKRIPEMRDSERV